MRNGIPLKLKKKCVQMKQEGVAYKEIYEFYCSEIDGAMSYSSFARALRKWCQKVFPDDTTLLSGTYEGFTAHGATVQVSADGEIVQAWIKQTADSFDVDAFMQGIRECVEPYQTPAMEPHENSEMLEIPLFDMHWGINYLRDYQPVLDKILNVINEKHWSKIVIPFGQDFFHNDSIVHGITSNGTQIEKVDMTKAVKESRVFMYALIEAAIQNGSEVRVLYTPGNHDRSISWMFIQVLLERYGEKIIDDSFEYRKCFTYGHTAVMVTHGDSKQVTPRNLASLFPVSFPNEFADAVVREVHAGHLHHESEADIFGIMVRRLSSGTKTDEWSDKEDFVGSHKRFMLFRWGETTLKAIYYI